MAVKLPSVPGSDDGDSNHVHPLIPFCDYSPWERKVVRKSQKPTLRLKVSKVEGTGQAGLELDFTTQRPKSKTKASRKGTTETAEIRLLRSEVDAKKTSRNVYHKYVRDLLVDNISMVSAIMDIEAKTQTSTDIMLEKYQHFKSAMSGLQEKSNTVIAEAEEELEKYRRNLHKDIEKLRTDVAKSDDVLQKSIRQLQMLRHYKDKEFPVRVISIEQLKENLEDQRAVQLEELEVLKSQILKEKENYEQRIVDVSLDLEANAFEVCLSTTKRSIRTKAIQNKIMEKEILIHRRTKEELNEAILELKKAIESMKQALYVFADVFIPKSPDRKCLPDSKVILNIPTQPERLPI